MIMLTKLSFLEENVIDVFFQFIEHPSYISTDLAELGKRKV